MRRVRHVNRGLSTMRSLANPRLTSRIAGFFYLMNVAFAPGMSAIRKVFVAGDAARTAANLATHSTLFQIGFAGNVIAIASYVVVAALFYQLFKPVDSNISFLAACFGLMGCAVLAVSSAFYIGALHQSASITVVLIKLYAQAYYLSFVFFAVYCFLIGYLIYNSSFLPRILGILMMLGIGGLVFLAPEFGRSVFGFVLLGSVGELALTVWLLLFGVNPERWSEVSSRSSA